jgi:protein TonB
MPSLVQEKKKFRCMHRPIIAGIVFFLLPQVGSAMRSAVFVTSGLHLQESETGTPLGKLNVPAQKMAGNCITMVTPHYPQTAEESPKAFTVVVRVVVWKSGKVSPMQVVSGPPVLEAEAMNAVRLWRYKPYIRDGEPLDVTTEVRVDFDSTKSGGAVIHPTH